MHHSRKRVQVGVPLGCGVAEGGGTGPGFAPVVLGEGFAGGSAGGREAEDAGGPEGSAAVALPDGFGRVEVAEGCGRAAAVVVAGAGATGAPETAAVFGEGESVPAEAGDTAPSELPPANRTVASPQTTTPAADAARAGRRNRPPRRRVERPGERRGGAEAADGTSSGVVARCTASPAGVSAARPQPGQESAPLRWRRQGVQ
ncbi:hypothetical protein ACGF07_30560 [Kitasatospora sp. NPDC048194]|uniref:hypothetical protein n=1 Tax=Kitasatospora sp. NPDC048194 TaxID=3364045 RepID=UPI00371914EA